MLYQELFSTQLIFKNRMKINKIFFDFILFNFPFTNANILIGNIFLGQEKMV